MIEGEKLDLLFGSRPLEQAEDHHHGHQQEQQGRRPDRGALDGGEIRGLTAGAKRQIEDQRQRRGRQDIFQAAAENAAQVHLLRGGGRNQSVRYRGDVVAEGRFRYDRADHQRRRGPDQIADGVKNGADHEDGAHRGPGGEGDQAGEQKRGGHELVAQEVELNEIVCQGVHQADHGGKGVGHTHQLHMAEQGSLGAAGHGGIGPVRKGCHGHADGSAVAGQGDGVVAVRGHGDGNQQPILGAGRRAAGTYPAGPADPGCSSPAPVRAAGAPGIRRENG